MTKQDLLKLHPLLAVTNKQEFKQRLQWLSEGMLFNHMNGVVYYEINEQEKEDFLSYKKTN